MLFLGWIAIVSFNIGKKWVDFNIAACVSIMLWQVFKNGKTWFDFQYTVYIINFVHEAIRLLREHKFVNQSNINDEKVIKSYT